MRIPRASFVSLAIVVVMLTACGGLFGEGGGEGEGEGEGEGDLTFPAFYTATIDFELATTSAVDEQVAGTYAIVASFTRTSDEREGTYELTGIQVAGQQDSSFSGEGGVVQRCAITNLVVAEGGFVGSLAVVSLEGQGLMFIGSVDWTGYGTETCDGREPTPDAPLSLHVSAPQDYCGDDFAFVPAASVTTLHYADSATCVQPTLDDVTVSVDWTADAS